MGKINDGELIFDSSKVALVGHWECTIDYVRLKPILFPSAAHVYSYDVLSVSGKAALSLFSEMIEKGN